MHAGKRYGLIEFILWTRWDIYKLIPIALIPTTVYHFSFIKWLAVPWVPVALIGTAAAFILGFKNTQTYARLWEGRQIFGVIVTASRTWGIMTKDFVKGDRAIKQQLIRTHLAWLTALRYQLREPRIWENLTKSYNKEYLKYYTIPERENKMDDELTKYLSSEDLHYIIGKKNKAAQLITLQSKNISELKQKGLIEPMEYIEMEKKLADLLEQQGKCEHLKDFPYPRQFASINKSFIWLFVFILPFGMLNEFAKLGDTYVWLNVPFSILVSWVFTSLEKVGESTENPFEGGVNDVPITALSRAIEIDLQEMMNESNLPESLQPVNNILM
ncbi:bestrophin family ion channel [soil metagenome]